MFLLFQVPTDNGETALQMIKMVTDQKWKRWVKILSVMYIQTLYGSLPGKELTTTAARTKLQSTWYYKPIDIHNIVSVCVRVYVFSRLLFADNLLFFADIFGAVLLCNLGFFDFTCIKDVLGSFLCASHCAGVS